MKAPESSPTCVVCGAPDATPRIGHTLPMCFPCTREWRVGEADGTVLPIRDFIARKQKACEQQRQEQLLLEANLP